ncbi:hypothetical protein ACEPAF_4783 [Sanghuangporus sanghuang]
MLLVDMSNIEVQKEVTVEPDGAQTSRAFLSSDDLRRELTSQTATKMEKQPLMELKNGKLVFHQKPLSCEKMSETMQEIVNFRDFLANRAKESNSPLQYVPDEHVPLIAKLVHESDKTISFLAKHLQEALRPEETEADEANSSGASLTTIAIESAILRVCDRINYGIDWMEKVSAATSVWRWEVKEQMYRMLPKASRERFESRLAERRQAKQELKALFDALPQSEKDAFTKSGKKAKPEISHVSSTNDENNPNTLTATDGQIDTKSNAPTDENTEAKKSGRPKKDKPVDPERLAKEKEKAEKKAAKEEKERKLQEAQNKSRSIMNSFFSKPKATSSKIQSPASASSSQKKEAFSSQSEFEKAFKPFILKKNATLAPINYFHEARAKEVIVIDPSDPASRTHEVPSNSQELFSEYIKRVSSKRRMCPGSYNTNGLLYKSSSAHSVRDIFARLSEAEILGDDTAVRSLQTLLASRDKIPAKVLIFHEDYRPGYFGTFTKSSVVVGPRTSFAKDAVVFDYSYDSGEDWEEEEEGADDLQSLAGSDVEKSSDVGDDEFDDWLVDDDEPSDPGMPLDSRSGSPSFPFPQDLMPKRKTAPAEKESKEPKKRKVMPLIPFSKGLCLETNIGECDYEPFNQYRIQLFNDTPFPIDPFTFVSTPVIIGKLALSKQGFVVPTLPPHVQNTSSNVNSMGVTVPTCSAQAVIAQSSIAPMATVPTPVKRASIQPKNPFPTALIPYFADKVASLNSGNLTWLVESLYQDLRPHRVKKNAIEAKVREDCEKCPVRKVWIVKEDVLRTLGRTPLPLPNA